MVTSHSETQDSSCHHQSIQASRPIRMVLSFFLTWRISHPNTDAVWLWGMSVVWFTFSWILNQLPKLCPVNRATDLDVLKENFETPGPNNPTGKSDLPGLDIFVSTADPEKELPLVTANITLLTFEAMAEAASFANMWVPFCHKHNIESRNPESYFYLKKDPYKNKVLSNFVKDCRRMKREYDKFKVRINSLPVSIQRRSNAYHAREELKAWKEQRQKKDNEPFEAIKIKKATWMADGTHWLGTWLSSSAEHSKGDHAGIIQVMLKPPSDKPLHSSSDEPRVMDLTDVDIASLCLSQSVSA